MFDKTRKILERLITVEGHVKNFTKDFPAIYKRFDEIEEIIAVAKNVTSRLDSLRDFMGRCEERISKLEPKISKDKKKKFTPNAKEPKVKS